MGDTMSATFEFLDLSELVQSHRAAANPASECRAADAGLAGSGVLVTQSAGAGVGTHIGRAAGRMRPGGGYG